MSAHEQSHGFQFFPYEVPVAPMDLTTTTVQIAREAPEQQTVDALQQQTGGRGTSETSWPRPDHANSSFDSSAIQPSADALEEAGDPSWTELYETGRHKSNPGRTRRPTNKSAARRVPSNQVQSRSLGKSRDVQPENASILVTIKTLWPDFEHHYCRVSGLRKYENNEVKEPQVWPKSLLKAFAALAEQEPAHMMQCIALINNEVAAKASSSKRQPTLIASMVDSVAVHLSAARSMALDLHSANPAPSAASIITPALGRQTSGQDVEYLGTVSLSTRSMLTQTEGIEASHRILEGQEGQLRIDRALPNDAPRQSPSLSSVASIVPDGSARSSLIRPEHETPKKRADRAIQLRRENLLRAKDIQRLQVEKELIQVEKELIQAEKDQLDTSFQIEDCDMETS